MFALPASFKIGVGNVLLATLIPPLALLVLNRVASIERIREESIALQKALDRNPICHKFDSRELKRSERGDRQPYLKTSTRYLRRHSGRYRFVAMLSVAAVLICNSIELSC